MVSNIVHDKNSEETPQTIQNYGVWCSHMGHIIIITALSGCIRRCKVVVTIADPGLGGGVAPLEPYIRVEIPP